MSFFKVNSHCNGCLACVQNCPASALKSEDRDDKRTLSHNMALCARCGQCWRICPQEAILFEHLLVSDWDEVIRVDLIRCEACGEPIYAAPFGESLDHALKEPPANLCSRHRQLRSTAPWPTLGSPKLKRKKK